jgi:TATA-box binding protein (TBP) (component of TFIID and TFIIIB)
MIYFSPYRISTITSNADILHNDDKFKIDLHKLFHTIPINDKSRIIWTQFQDKEENRMRGEYPKKKRRQTKKTEKKRMFDNQVTLLYRTDQNYFPNIKIFQNGNIQMTGTRTINECYPIIEYILNYIGIIHDVKLTYHNFKIRLINTDFRVYKDSEFTNRFAIKRKELHKALIEDTNIISSFQPGSYPAIRIEYFYNTNNTNGICECKDVCMGKNTKTTKINCKKVTIAVFESGSILITGGIDEDQVQKAYNFISNFISKSEARFEKKTCLLLDTLSTC